MDPDTDVVIPRCYSGAVSASKAHVLRLGVPQVTRRLEVKSLHLTQAIDNPMVSPPAFAERRRFGGEGPHRSFDSVPVPIANCHDDVTVFFLVYFPAVRLMVVDGELLGMRGLPQEPDVHA